MMTKQILAGVALAAGNWLAAAEPAAEAHEYIDEVSQLPVTQLTTQGLYNQGPTMHLYSAFADGGKSVVFAGVRDGRSYLMKGDLATKQLTVLFTGPEIPDYRSDDAVTTMKCRRTIQGNNIAVSPGSNYAAVVLPGDNTLTLVNLTDRSSKVLLQAASDCYFICTPSISKDGRWLAVPVVTEEIKESYNTRLRNPTGYLRFDLTDLGKAPEVLLKDEWGQPHILFNPADPDLFLVKLGRPSHLAPDRESARSQPSYFILDRRDHRLTPVTPRNRYKDITHISWNYRGDRIVYHGNAAGGGNYIGAMDRDGKVIWEHIFKDWTWEKNGENHIAADTVSDLIFDDGIAVNGQISAIDYSRAASDGEPVILPVAIHRNEWRKIPGQLGHPHPNVSPDGKFLQFNAFRDGKTNVYLVDLTKLRQSQNQ